MSVQVSCPKCGKRLRVAEENLGRSARCPHCNQKIRLPEAPSLAPALRGGAPSSASPPPLAPPHGSDAPTEPPPLSPAGVPAAEGQAATTLSAERAERGPSEARGLASELPAGGTHVPVGSPVADSQPTGTEEQGDSMELSFLEESASGGTNVSMLASSLIGLGVTIVFYLAVLPLHKTYVGALFVHRGWVPYVIMLLTFWSAAILFLKRRKIARQRSSLLLDVLPVEVGSDITPENTVAFYRHIRGLNHDPASSFLITRVKRALAHFRSRRNAQEVAALLASQAEIDASAVQSSYRMVKVFIWAIPILGFIGTVLGIGIAVGGFSEAIEGAQQIDTIKTSLGGVTSGLALAFDTTLLALVMSICLMFPTSSLQKAEEDALNSVDEYCNESLLRRLSDGGDSLSSGNEQIAAVIREVVERRETDFDRWTERLGEVGANLSRHMSESWLGVQQRAQRDNERLVEQVRDVLRSTSDERRAFLDQVKAIQHDQVQRLDTTLARMAQTSSELQGQIADLQQSQVRNFQDVVAALAGQLQQLQKQSHQQHAADAETLGSIADKVARSLDTLQQRTDKAQTAATARMNDCLAALAQQLSGVGDEASRIFREQLVPLQEVKQSLEETAARVAEQMEQIRPVHTQAVADIRSALQQSIAEMRETLADRFQQPLERLDGMAVSIADQMAMVQSEGVQSRKALSEAGRRSAETIEQSIEHLGQTVARMTETLASGYQEAGQRISAAEEAARSARQAEFADMAELSQTLHSRADEHIDRLTKVGTDLIAAMEQNERNLSNRLAESVEASAARMGEAGEKHVKALSSSSVQLVKAFLKAFRETLQQAGTQHGQLHESFAGKTSAEIDRLSRTANAIVRSLKRNGEVFEQHVRTFTGLLESFGETQRLLAEGIQTGAASPNSDAALDAVAQSVTRLTPVLEHLGQQVDRFSSLPENTDGRGRKKGWFRR